MDFESKLEGPDEFVAESMPLPAYFAVKKVRFWLDHKKKYVE